MHTLRVTVARTSCNDGAPNTLSTSGFVNDVMFSRNGANGPNQRRRVCFVEFFMLVGVDVAVCDSVLFYVLLLSLLFYHLNK